MLTAICLRFRFSDGTLREESESESELFPPSRTHALALALAHSHVRTLAQSPSYAYTQILSREKDIYAYHLSSRFESLFFAFSLFVLLS